MREFILIYGCMFAGKTTKLIGMYNESEVAYEEKIAVKPLLDKRYNPNNINAHSGLQMVAHRINKAEELYPLCNELIKEVYIDEIQFFGPYIVHAVSELMMNGIRVVAAGLDKDYLNQDFGPMADLKRIATQKIQVSAKCHVCGAPANFTYREPGIENQIAVGHTDIYQARCQEHWTQGMDGRL